MLSFRVKNKLIAENNLVNMNNGNVNNNNKNNDNNVRAVSEFQGNNNAVGLEGWFEAYYSCRRNKGRSHNACKFEIHHESNLIALWREVERRRYIPERSISFIITKPVKREIFAADFRDRVVHHWIARRIEPILERRFIADSYNCRKEKGTLAGVMRVAEHIREESRNYTSDCWVMKLDLKGFFMSIDREMLTQKLCVFVDLEYEGEEKDTLQYLIRRTLINAPERNCITKGNRDGWGDLDPNKSLFTNGDGFGLPIGNLTSQMAANFLLDETDHFITDTLGLRMVRYVDDYCLIDGDKSRLLSAASLIREHLKQTAGVTLHPKKFYFQHYTKGVKFIGAVIKPGRIYVSNRTVASAINRIYGFNEAAKKPGWALSHIEDFVASMNSYLGLMKHFATYAIRRKLINRINSVWWRFVEVDSSFTRLTIKRYYKPLNRAKRRITHKRINPCRQNKNSRQSGR